MADDEERRGRGRLTRKQFELTAEQREALAGDYWFTVKEAAGLLGISEQAVRNAITKGSLTAFLVPEARGKPPIMQIKGWRLMVWRDRCAGLSDGDETGYEQVG